MRSVTAARLFVGWLLLAWSTQAGSSDFSISGSSSGDMENLTLTANVRVAPGDIGTQGVIYVAAHLAGTWFFKSANGTWHPWTGGAIPAPYYSGALLDSHVVSITDRLNLIGYGGTEVYVGYGANQNDMLNNSKYARVYAATPSLAMGGVPFRFLGGFVPGWHWGADTWSRSADDDLIWTARENGITVLHAMLPLFETRLGAYDEAELVKLDHFLDSAYRNSVYVIPAFSHGVDIATQSYNPYYHPRGIEGLVTDPSLGAAYLNRIRHLVTRRNSVNQRLYRDDPTILGWIIIDEPISAPWNYSGGAPNVSSTELNAWLGNVAEFIKSLDPNHLVTVFTTAAIDRLGEDWLQALNVSALDFIYAEDADLRILNYFRESNAGDFPLILPSLNKPVVMMLSFTSGEWNQESICSDYAWQGQMLNAAASRYFEVGSNGVTVFLWGSDRYPFVPSFDRCYAYTASNQAVAQKLRQVSQSINPLAEPRPPLGFVGVR